MKQLKVTTVIKECSDCPYANIWGLYCNKHKRKLPDADQSCGLRYIIPEWCMLDEFGNDEYTPELLNCNFIGGHCIGVSCICVDHDTSVMTKDPHEIRFKCKNYNNITIIRR